MADRVTGKAATITADIRGLTDETVTITLSNPYGTAVATDASTTNNGHGRYSYTTPALTVPGIWTAEWSYNSSVVKTQDFSVGPRLGYARAVFDLRTDVARRVVGVHEGRVLESQSNSISDPTLYGGAGDYQGWWIVPDYESDDAGRALMVQEYNGSTLQVVPQFWAAMSENDRYILMEVHPAEVDRAIQVAVQDLTNLSRIQISLPALTLTDNLVTLPDHITHVTEVWVPDDDEDLVRVGQTAWDTKPGRKLYVDTEEDTVTVTVLANATVPLWDDSLVDIEPASVIARAAHLLHANRAGSSTIDLEEHLRRQLAARDEYEQSKRSGVGRIPPGSRKVID